MTDRSRAAFFSPPPVRRILAGGALVIAGAFGATGAWRHWWQVEALPPRHFPLIAADAADQWWLLPPGDARRPSNPYPTPACTDAEEPRHPGPGINPPEVVESVVPSRFGIARRSELRGVVVLAMVIGTDGRPCAVRVLRGLPMGLDREAVAAVHRWRFRPARAGDRAVPVYFRVEIKFDLGP